MRDAIARYAGGLYQLSRPDPAASWAGGAFAIGAAIAAVRVGTELRWRYGLLALVGVVAAISLGAHGINDAYDWLTGTDRESIGEGTGGSRVIPQGALSVVETALIGVVGLAIAFAAFAVLFLEYGRPILALAALVLGAPIAYSLPPLKLAYRPFAELIVVVPALTAVTLTAELVLSGAVTPTGALAGLVHAAFSISWFVVSRLPDYEPDARAGKTTTVVYLGRESAPTIAAAYLLCGVGLSLLGLATFGWPFAVTPAFGAYMLVGLVRLNPSDPGQASAIRYRQMRSSTVHALALAAAIAAAGVP